MELQKAKAIAEELKALLEPVCQRVEIAGSIRRQKPEVGDIELLVIPKHGGLAGESSLWAEKQAHVARPQRHRGGYLFH